MGAKTGIEWTDATWSPIRARVKADAGEIAKAKGYTSLVQIAEKMRGRVGQHCEHVSPGCERCYAETNNHRCLPANGTGLPYDRRSRDLVDVFVDEKHLLLPLSWRAPKKIFPENQSDLFAEWVTDEMLDRVFAVMALCPQHTFQVLTKRAERMLEYFADLRARTLAIIDKMADIRYMGFEPDGVVLPLANVWLGVSDEGNQHQRIDILRQTPAAVRFISGEPLLFNPGTVNLDGIDWVIVGGESGAGARPMHLDWARGLRDQCQAAGVPFFFKQWGAWAPGSEFRTKNTCAVDRSGRVAVDGLIENYPPDASSADGWAMMHRVGKHKAGVLLDGVEWKQFPAVRALERG